MMSRIIRGPTSGEPSAVSFPMRPDSGPRKSRPAKKVVAYRTSAITIQSSPKP